MKEVLVFLFSAFVILAKCQKGGGMAELKSITGDAPYNGIGNAPAPIRQPMGFWGRPRYAPPGAFIDGPYGNLGPGGIPYSPYYNRFSSVGSSPYGLGGWHSSW